MQAKTDGPAPCVAYITTPVDFGGSERVGLNFLQNVDATKYHIVPILLLRPWEEQNFFRSELEKSNIPYHVIPVALKPREEGTDYFRIPRCFGKLYSLIKKYHFGLIHSNGYFADIIAVPLARLFGIPCLSTCHGFIDNDPKLRFYNRLDYFMLNHSEKIIAVSEPIRDLLAKKGVDGRRIEFLANAVQSHRTAQNGIGTKAEIRKRHGIPDGDFVAGYIGRLSVEKGVDNILKALAILKNEGILVKVMIIGDGPKRGDLEEMASRLNIAELVLFLGFRQEPAAYLEAMDLFILPSLTEGTPMALLEAMSAGVPIIASSVGGIPDIVKDGEHGLLIRSGDFAGLSKAVKRLLREPELRNLLACNASSLIERNYGMGQWIQRLDSIYQDLMGRHPNP